MAMAFAPQLQQLDAVKAALLQQPEDLYQARLAEAEAARVLKTAKKRLGDVEAEIADALADIAALVAGDKTLKNAAARKLEVRTRAKDEPAIAALEERRAPLEAELLNAEMAKTAAELQVKRREDEQRAWRGRLDALAIECSLLVAGR